MRKASSPRFVESLEARTLFVAGAYDTTLAGIGYITHSVNNTNDAIDVLKQSDGLIVAVGDTQVSGASKRGLIARYTNLGAIDTGFGINGTRDWSMGGGDTIVTGVAQQADGKLVVVGYVGSGTAIDIFVCRFTTSGAFDNTFSGDGQMTIDFSGNAEIGTGIAIDPASQKIYVCGTTAGFSSTGAVLCRITTSGALDTSFAGQGKNIFFPGAIDFINGSATTYISGRMTLQADGKPVVAMTLATATAADLAVSTARMGVARANTNGTLDTTFASFSSIPGFSAVKFNRTIEIGTSVAIDSRTGKIVLCGTTANGTTSFGTPLPSNFAPIKAATKANFGVARFTASGASDKKFSGDGKIQIDFDPTRLDGASDVMVDDNGFIVVGGGSQIRKSASKMAATRLSPGGGLDTTFATGGLFITDIGGSEGFFGGVLQDDNNRYLFSGHHKTSGTRGKLLIVRLLDV